MIEASLLPIQKCLLFLHVMKERNRECYFRDVKEHLKRSKSQVSVLLSSLEESDLISRENKRPQPITITSLGEETIKNKILHEIEFYYSHLNNDQSKNQPEKKKDTSTLKLNKGKVISTYLKILRPKIQEDLDLISQYITAEALEELTNSLTETIELSLHKLFRSLKL
jgi:DNA-binding MarR family transcriptional regulator